MATRSAALDGLRLMTLAPNLPGPVAAARLRSLGMAVTKVEGPGGDPAAHYAPAWYAELHEGIEVVRLDLKTTDGRAELQARLSATDLLLTSHRLATLERLGLAWPTLHAAHPTLCHVAIVGEAPPRDGVPGHDLTYQAAAGLLTPPHLPVSLLADLGGALEAVVAALALLVARDRHGEAGMTLVALADAATYFAEPLCRGLTRPQGGLLGGGYAMYDVYRAMDGWVAVAALEGHFRERLLAHFPGDGSERDRLAAGFMQRSAADWHAWAEAEDLPIAALHTV